MRDGETVSRPVLSRLALEIGFSLATMVVGGVVLFAARELERGWSEAGPGPGFFPTGIGIIIVAASLATLAQALWIVNRADVALTGAQARRVARFGLPIVAFVVATQVIGMYVATVLYLVGTMTWQGGYGLARSLLVAIVATVAFYFVFEWWFQVPLPKGPIEAWLGLH